MLVVGDRQTQMRVQAFEPQIDGQAADRLLDHVLEALPQQAAVRDRHVWQAAELLGPEGVWVIGQLLSTRVRALRKKLTNGK